MTTRRTNELWLRSRRVVTPEGVRPATVRVAGERIAAIEAHDAPGDSARLLDLGDAVVMPGVVDTHVHVNEPGRTEWEGFETATRAAAAGGVTTIVDMPLNCVPVTTTPDAVAVKARSVAGKASVDYAFWGGLVPANAGAMDALLDAGVPGVKGFLVPSGIDEFPEVREEHLRLAMPALARRGAVLLVHAEVPGPIDAAAVHGHGDPRSYATWLASRPNAAEDEAIALVLRLSEETRCRVHVVHLSSATALPMLADAKKRGAPVTVETCPHYLTFDAEEIPDGRTEFKCAPPIRERENRERLWRGLADGTIDMVVSDHSPCTPGLKSLEKGDYLGAWGGIASLQLALPALWTEARRRGFGVERVAEWMCRRPAALAGLAPRKGSLVMGADADLVVWYPERDFTVERGMIRHRHSLTPYLGRALSGVVGRTVVRGHLVFESGVSSPPSSASVGRRVASEERG